MNRRTLIKSLFTIAVAPKVLSEFNLEAPLVAPKSSTNQLFKDLVFVVPYYMPKLIEKYGNTNWGDQWELLAKDKIENPKLYEFKSDLICQNT